MDRAEKRELVTGLNDAFKGAGSVVVAHYAGITVAQMNDLRSKMRAAGGTVTTDVAGAVKASKGGAVEFRVEKAGIVHAGIGKASFEVKALEENVRAFADAVSKAKPAGAKGNYIKKVSVTSTMGPGLKLDIASLTA